MLKALGLLLRIYSYIFFLVTSLLLLGIALLATVSRQPLNLHMLPLDDSEMLWGTYAIAFGGLLAAVLGLLRKLRILYPLWAAATLYSLVKGYFFSSYVFHGVADLQAALWFIGGAALAFAGALWTLKPRRGRLYS